MERHCKNGNKNCIQLLLLVLPAVWVAFFCGQALYYICGYMLPPSMILKYANNALKGIVKRNHTRLRFYDLMSEVYLTWEIKIPG